MSRPMSSRAFSTLVLALFLAACGDDGMAPPASTGTARLIFQVTRGVRASPNLQDELNGDIYGQLFLAQEVGVTGPRDGAVEQGDVDLIDVDLRDETTMDVEFITGELAPNMYIFLGFFDVDGNGAETKDPDAGDPVTLPVNDFEVIAGSRTPVEVTFDLVFN